MPEGPILGIDRPFASPSMVVIAFTSNEVKPDIELNNRIDRKMKDPETGPGFGVSIVEKLTKENMSDIFPPSSPDQFVQRFAASNGLILEFDTPAPILAEGQINDIINVVNSSMRNNEVTGWLVGAR